MVGTALVKSLYVLPTWTRTVRLVAERAALRDAIGGAPSVDACYRFTRKLREHRDVLDSCLAAVLASLHDELPEFGEHVAIDGSAALATLEDPADVGSRERDRSSPLCSSSSSSGGCRCSRRPAARARSGGRSFGSGSGVAWPKSRCLGV